MSFRNWGTVGLSKSALFSALLASEWRKIILIPYICPHCLSVNVDFIVLFTSRAFAFQYSTEAAVSMASSRGLPSGAFSPKTGWMGEC